MGALAAWAATAGLVLGLAGVTLAAGLQGPVYAYVFFGIAAAVIAAMGGVVGYFTRPGWLWAMVAGGFYWVLPGLSLLPGMRALPREALVLIPIAIALSGVGGAVTAGLRQRPVCLPTQ